MQRGPQRASIKWLSWLLGLAGIAALVTVVAELSEERAFLRMVERANPWWLAVALGLQALTYAAQGSIWRRIARTRAMRVPIRTAMALSLTKLFVDQSIPSGGLSGAAVVAGELERRGLPAPIATAIMIADVIGYYAAYAAALALALIISVIEGHARAVILVPALLFGVFAAAIVSALLVLSGRASVGTHATRLPIVRRMLGVLQRADRGVIRNRRNLTTAGVLEATIIVLDALTVYTLVRALGSSTSIVAVYVAFLVSSLFRTVSITPAGLGAFEAVSVITLESTGLPLEVALSATLLFRGLSFWLPMIPGLIVARSIRRSHVPAG